MDTVRDFEDILHLLHRHNVRFLIVGGLAFIYHAKPRYTKDIDLWIDPDQPNIKQANLALSEFGSPILLPTDNREEIVQIGVAPNRIDCLLSVGETDFNTAWPKRISGTYGQAQVNWIDIDTLIEIKGRIDDPRHQDDARILKEVKKKDAR